MKIEKILYNKKPFITLLAILRTWILIIASLTIFLKFLPIYLLPIYVVVMGTLQYHLNILGHDGLHFSLASSKKANDFICRFFLHGPQGAPLTLMRSNHLNHHRNLGKDIDSDRQYYGLEQFKDSLAYKKWIFMSFLGGMFIPIILKLMNSRKPSNIHTKKKISKDQTLDYISIAATQAIIFIYVFYLTGSPFSYLYAWVLPLFTVMFGLNTLRSNLEHAKHHDHPDQPLLFTFRPSKFVRFFISPFNMNYHAEHHSYPGVPFYNLEKVTLDSSQEAIVTYTCYSERFKDILSIYLSINQIKLNFKNEQKHH